MGRIPDTARTMIGDKRLENVRLCVEIVCKEGIEGDFAELGCWSGGCGIWAKACFNVYGSQVRVVRCIDDVTYVSLILTYLLLNYHQIMCRFTYI